MECVKIFFSLLKDNRSAGSDGQRGSLSAFFYFFASLILLLFLSRVVLQDLELSNPYHVPRMHFPTLPLMMHVIFM